MKLTGGAADVLKLVNGLSGLAGGAGAATGVAGKAASNLGASAAGVAASRILSGAQLASSVNGGPVLDWLTHESPIAGILNGTETVGDFLTRKGDEIEQNASTFWSDWDSNYAWRGFANFLTAGFAYGHDDPEVDENEALIRADIERMNSMTAESNGEVVRSTSEMTQAANEMKGLPALIASAVETGMSRVTILVDVDSMANALMPRIGGGMASTVLATVK